MGGFSDIHPDIIQTKLLPRLDGCSLATVSCASATLRSLSSSHHLWTRICNNTWPSTNTPRLHQLISSFPNGPLSFFSLAFPLLHPHPQPNGDVVDLHLHHPNPPPEALISAVDLFYKGKQVLSKAHQTETATGWFRSAPFRIDLLDAKEVVPTPIPTPSLDDTFQDLYRHLELSWILIDPKGLRAVNVSSMSPVSVHRHWLTGEVQAKFATVMEGVVCVMEVTWADAGDEGPMRVREVGLEVEDVEGTRLSGKDSLHILQRALEYYARRRVGVTSVLSNSKSKYEEFMERRRERKERRKREEAIWDMLYVSMALVFFAALFLRCFWTR